MTLDDLHAVIPAGGAGTRLWPLSRTTRPKFLLDLTGSGRTLLQETWDRLRLLLPPERIHVVTGPAHADGVRTQLPELENIVVEPSPRDSMPAIGLAAAIIAERDPEAVIASFAADHLIDGSESFEDAVRQAAVAARTGLVATIGIEPRSPSTAFGYIEAGDPLGLDGAPDALAITRFVEKPDAETAEAYLESGRFSWNAGMFVTRTSVLLDHLARLQPTLDAGLRRIAAAWDTEARADELEAHWPALTKIAIDHAIAEPVSLEGGMAVVPGRFAWDDVGDYAALSRIAPDVDGRHVLVESTGFVRADDGRTVAVVGLQDVVVVSTDDTVLVTTVDAAQLVKQVPARLGAEGRTDLV